ncbi:tyrosine-type recombinase/integrase [Cellulophaga tyrosinoxydans]|uniref:Site-specific recombinase XerD n=1 Tax=Cellulophaga tyrosinoxydans TaxID=504486 RepID=A0A1W2CPS5_9FLAO|nr:tyrosine-type recombinase/integrase [Cellulophaga tyrosinoxydans]SMC87230.1 Site-specific recombinase XerD [Cellulophaga tyrosinoxydans]
MYNRTITFSKINYDKKELLLIDFPYDFKTKEYIKKFDGVTWHSRLKRFCLPFSKHLTNTFFKYLRAQNYFVDYSALKKNYTSAPTRVSTKIKLEGKPNKAILERIGMFKKWMIQKRYSESTIKTYESMLLTFFSYHSEKSAQEIDKTDLEDYNFNYIIANGFSYTYQNQTINALKLFYTYDGLDPLLSSNLERPKNQSKLPEVLSIAEVKIILSSLANLKHRTLLSLLYACGLRIGETLNIKIKDLDLKRGFTHIRSGKGHKDRYVPIPIKMCELLHRYIETYKPSSYLFEGINNSKYSPVSARQILRRALSVTKIKKPITLHTLRHSHATHLLENGTDIRYIQELLGHNSPKTTMIYTHVSTTSLDKIKNPFNDFEI